MSPLKDFFKALEEERQEYGLSPTSGLSTSFLNEISNRYNKDLQGDKILLSSRKDFPQGGAHYDTAMHTIRLNKNLDAPSVASHEIGHAFSSGADIRGHRGLLNKLVSTSLAFAPDAAGNLLFAAPGEYLAAKSLGSSVATPLAVTLGGGALLHLIGAAKRYSEEANASRLGISALRSMLKDDSAPRVGNIFKRLVDRLRYGKLNNADRKLIASNKTLEAALRTYKVGLGVNAAASGVSSLLKGTAAYGASKLLGADPESARDVTRGLAGLGGVITLGKILASSAVSTPDTRMREDMQLARTEAGDTDIFELNSGN
jgi:hypothetical protein